MNQFILVSCLLILGLVPVAFAQLDSDTIEQELADLINQYRQEQGLRPLDYDSRIAGVIESHLIDLKNTNTFQHNTPGKNYNSIKRGVDAGFQYCGYAEDIDKYKSNFRKLNQFHSDLTSYKQKGKLYQSSQSNNLALKNWLIQEKQRLLNEQRSVNSHINDLQGSIREKRIGIGLTENIAYFSFDYPPSQIANLTLNGWINSPGHKLVLLDPAESMGISVIEDQRNGRILVGLNTC